MSSARTRRGASLGAALLAVLAAGCVRGSLPPQEYYRLAVPEAAGATPARMAAARPPLRGTLAIAPYVTPGLYGEPSIVYRRDETAYGTYPSREWALPLGEMLGAATESVLREAPLADGGVLYDPPSRRGQTYVWRGTVREFEEVDRGSSVSASVRLDAVLLRAADDSLLWSGSVHLERAVRRPTMAGIVATLSELSGEAIRRLAAEAATSLAAPSAASARRER